MSEIRSIFYGLSTHFGVELLSAPSVAQPDDDVPLPVTEASIHPPATGSVTS
jgi:hypothetical protein